MCGVECCAGAVNTSAILQTRNHVRSLLRFELELLSNLALMDDHQHNYYENYELVVKKFSLVGHL